MTPRASIIIVTRGRPDLLGDVLRRLPAQTFRAHEIIVVDNETAERTQAAARAALARYVPAAGLSLGAARQAGVDASSGAILAFTDDDCIPAIDWLQRLVEALEAHPEWIGVQGATEPEVGPLDAHTVSVSRPNALRHTCNIAYRAESVRRVGGFDAAFLGWFEDTALAARLATLGPIGWEPRARVVHRAVRRRAMTRAAWRTLLGDERRLALRYPVYYRCSRGRHWLPTVVLRWLIGSPVKALIRALPRARHDPWGYGRLTWRVLRERINLVPALLDTVRHRSDDPR